MSRIIEEELIAVHSGMQDSKAEAELGIIRNIVRLTGDICSVLNL